MIILHHPQSQQGLGISKRRQNHTGYY